MKWSDINPEIQEYLLSQLPSFTNLFDPFRTFHLFKSLLSSDLPTEALQRLSPFLASLQSNYLQNKFSKEQFFRPEEMTVMMQWFDKLFFFRERNDPRLENDLKNNYFPLVQLSLQKTKEKLWSASTSSSVEEPGLIPRTIVMSFQQSFLQFISLLSLHSQLAQQEKNSTSLLETEFQFYFDQYFQSWGRFSTFVMKEFDGATGEKLTAHMSDKRIQLLRTLWKESTDPKPLFQFLGLLFDKQLYFYQFTRTKQEILFSGMIHMIFNSRNWLVTERKEEVKATVSAFLYYLDRSNQQLQALKEENKQLKTGEKTTFFQFPAVMKDGIFKVLKSLWRPSEEREEGEAGVVGKDNNLKQQQQRRRPTDNDFQLAQLLLLLSNVDFSLISKERGGVPFMNHLKETRILMKTQSSSTNSEDENERMKSFNEMMNELLKKEKHEIRQNERRSTAEKK
jgi:hypothetical protein